MTVVLYMIDGRQIWEDMDVSDHIDFVDVSELEEGEPVEVNKRRFVRCSCRCHRFYECQPSPNS